MEIKFILLKKYVQHVSGLHLGHGIQPLTSWFPLECSSHQFLVPLPRVDSSYHMSVRRVLDKTLAYTIYIREDLNVSTGGDNRQVARSKISECIL